MEIESQIVSNLPLVEKYRPKYLKDIVSHDDIVTTLVRFIEQKTIPHLLFHGPPGTGKTSCIMAIARALYEEKDIKHSVLELNASDDRGISIVREDIKDFCSASSLVIGKYRFKLVILDEADMMTTTAQAALRRVIEKFTSNVRFCLICNQVSKIIPAVQSRCLRVRFSPLNKDVCVKKVIEICDLEGMKILGKSEKEQSAIILKLVEMSKGDMRRILNLLESTSLSNKGIIEEEKIYRLSGKPSLQTLKIIYSKCKDLPYNKAFTQVWRMKAELGFTITDLIELIVNDVINDPLFDKMKFEDKIEFFNVLQKTELISKMGGNDKLCMANVVGRIQQLVENN